MDRGRVDQHHLQALLQEPVGQIKPVVTGGLHAEKDGGQAVFEHPLLHPGEQGCKAILGVGEGQGPRGENPPPVVGHLSHMDILGHVDADDGMVGGNTVNPLI
ncbi:hypothetical protein D3C71_1455660 [compost metagenome]